MNHVLLIEDDPRIRTTIERGLGTRGFTVSSAPEGDSGIELTEKLDVDLVLLDLLLPGRHGIAVLEDIRALKPKLPVILLTATADDASKVGGLDAGADDYVTKPFSMDELAARIRAHIRRQGNDYLVLKAGNLTVDVAAHRVALEGREVVLSARELSLLSALMRRPGRLLSRSQLLDEVWGIDFDPGSNVVDVYVAALRRKIGSHFIETVRGLGYRFVSPLPAREGDGREVAL